MTDCLYHNHELNLAQKGKYFLYVLGLVPSLHTDARPLRQAATTALFSARRNDGAV